MMKRKVKGDLFALKLDKNSDEWRAARAITHQWLGNSEYVRLDVTDYVARALLAGEVERMISDYERMLPAHPIQPSHLYYESAERI